MKISADWLHNTQSQQLMAAFVKAGFKAYFVGGCVRNGFLGVPVSDLDVSTDARPDQTTQIATAAGFKAIPTGAEHGTITVIVQGTVFEVTSFRKDVETHGRRAVVAFSADITDDARRRDFTMNALYADAQGQIIDPLNGLPDLQARHVRFIEDPAQRIKEDYLRILRYFRFFAGYGDQSQGLDPEALTAIVENLDGLASLSKERIGAELHKLLDTDDPIMAVAGMEQSGILGQILPGASAKLLGPVIYLEQKNGLPKDWLRRLIALNPAEAANALRLSRAESKRIATYIKARDSGWPLQETSYRYGRDVAWDQALILAAALNADIPPDAAKHIETGAQATFPVTATDLIDRFNGPALGAELRRLESDWIASGFAKTKTDLLAQ